MATDNAKERLVAKLGLNKQALSTVVNLVALSVPIKTAILLINIPEVQAIYTQAINKKEVTDPGVEKLLSEKRNYLEKFLKGEDAATDVKVDLVSVTDELLEKYLDVPIYTEEQLGEYDYNRDLFSIITTLLEATKVAKFTGNMRAISDLTNGLGKDIASRCQP